MKPFRGCQKNNITQGFKPEHPAVDFRGDYGTWLVAPEKCLVLKIISPTTIDLSPENPQLKRGFGIYLESLVKAKRYFLYWHCLPIFPVSIGEIVEAGQSVVQMGNSGDVWSNGVYVPIADRNKFPFPGTHLHEEMIVDEIAVDVSTKIDWSQEVNPINTLSVIQKILNKLKDFLKVAKIN
jgi:hypothetical protein